MLKLQSSSRQLYRKFSVSKPFCDKEQFIRSPSQVNVNLATIGDAGLSLLQIHSTFFMDAIKPKYSNCMSSKANTVTDRVPFTSEKSTVKSSANICRGELNTKHFRICLLKW